MKKLILVIPFLFICVNAYAGYYVFHTGETITGKRGPCGRACRIRPDALSVDEATYNSTNKAIHKVVGGVVVNKTQAELNAEAVTAQVASDAASTTAVNNLNVSVKDVFTAFIAVYNSKMPVQYRITAKELKDQIKLDKGL